MEYTELFEVKVKGKDLECPVCGNKRFATRRSLMNTMGMTFMGWDWLNKEADNLICSDCGYVFWFLESRSIRTTKIDQETDLPFGYNR